MRILMVCLGNICRSPLAEGILKHRANEKGIDLFVDSAGTGFWHVGQKPDKRSIAVAEKNGIDITYQRSRLFKKEDFQEFDLIYAMDENNINELLKKTKNDEEKQKIKLIMNEIYPGQNIPVPDPYYGGDSGFDEVFQMLNLVAEKILTDIETI
ncbi:MAG: low molecular weight protein-tyrosine-phosphatase [Flavobacteriales bacterium]